MKKFLSVLLAVTLLVTAGVQFAFASEQVAQGEVYYVTNFEDSDGNPPDSIYAESFTLSNSGFSSKYVERVYFDSSDNVCIKMRSGVSIDEQKEIKGTVTVREKGTGGKRYTARVSDVYIQPLERGFLNETSNGKFELPGNYGNAMMRFTTSEGNKVGTLNAIFSDSSGDVAYFDVRIVEQPNLFLGHNSADEVAVLKKYSDANLRFLKWTSVPKFNTSGTLGIYMESNEYLYQRNTDGSLTALTGKYNSERGALEIKTDTLRQYVVSDIKLSGVGAASSVAPESSSVAPPPASSIKPESSSVAPPPSSSVAPPPASSSVPEVIVPESSSAVVPESSSESSSEPAPPPSSSEPVSPSSTPTKPADTDSDGGFPVLPIIIGVVVVLVGGGAALLIFGKRNNGKKMDSWDE